MRAIVLSGPRVNDCRSRAQRHALARQLWKETGDSKRSLVVLFLVCSWFLWHIFSSIFGVHICCPSDFPSDLQILILQESPLFHEFYASNLLSFRTDFALSVYLDTVDARVVSAHFYFTQLYRQYRSSR